MVSHYRITMPYVHDAVVKYRMREMVTCSLCNFQLAGDLRIPLIVRDEVDGPVVAIADEFIVSIDDAPGCHFYCIGHNASFRVQ